MEEVKWPSVRGVNDKQQREIVTLLSILGGLGLHTPLPSPQYNVVTSHFIEQLNVSSSWPAELKLVQ